MLVHNLVVTGSLTFPTALPISGSLLVSGSVGINTASPAYALDVTGTGRFTNSVTGSNTNGIGGVFTSNTYFGSIDLQNTGGDVAGKWNVQANSGTQVGGSAGSSFGIYSYGASAYRLFINSSGSVGIGTVNPLEKLWVNLATNVNFAIGGTTRTRVLGVVNTNDNFCDISLEGLNVQFFSNGTERMCITSTGSIGIGTSVVTEGTQAAGSISIFPSSSVSSAPLIQFPGNGRIRPASTSDRLSIEGNALFLNNVFSGNIIMATGGGKVGIATSAPNFDVTIGNNDNQKILAVGTIHLVDAYINQGVFGCRIVGADNGVDGTNMQFQGRTTASGGFSTRMTITTGGNIGAPSGTNIYNASDRRLKRNVTPLSDALNKILNLNPVMFNWIQGYEPTEEDKDMLGFIAQDMLEVVPEAVESFAGGGTMKVGELEITNPLRVNEKFIIPVLVKAIQEQQTLINALTTRITALEN